MVVPNQAQSAARGCKIVRLGWNNQYEVYDSLDRSTISTGRIPATANITLHESFGSNTVSIGTVIYFKGNYPDGIMSYDVMTGKWEQFLIPDPPNSAGVCLAECDGRIWLAGLVKNKEWRNLCVWELQTEPTLGWKEVDRMPRSWCSKFHKPVFFRLMSNRRLLMMAISTGRVHLMFMYDLAAREWSKVPNCTPPGQTNGALDMDNGIGFFPCPSASP